MQSLNFFAAVAIVFLTFVCGNANSLAAPDLSSAPSKSKKKSQPAQKPDPLTAADLRLLADAPLLEDVRKGASVSDLNQPDATGATIVVVGHRGASGYRPEHTRSSYLLAIEQGADFIEPDLVMTKDGVLIVRHEPELSETTDVGKKFPDRKTTKKVDGQDVTGWFSTDLTLKEMKTLRAKERVATRDHSYDFQESVLTFDEVIELVQTMTKKTGRVIGLYPELKHPTFFAKLGLPLEPAFLKTLKKFGWDQPSSRLLVQSFEITSLKKLRETTNLRTMLLYDAPSMHPPDFVDSGDARTYGDLLHPEGMRSIANSLYGIAPYKGMIFLEGADKSWSQPTHVIQAAHALGLKVHPYTFRSDAVHLPAVYAGDPIKEYLKFFEAGVDGVFSDFPDHAIAARKQFLKQR